MKIKKGLQEFLALNTLYVFAEGKKGKNCHCYKMVNKYGVTQKPEN